MTDIWCNNYDCKFNKGDKCSACMVEMSEDGCETFEAYKVMEEYKAPYYKRVKAEKKKIARALSYGKKIVVNGTEFYTESPPFAGDSHTFLTDGKTGYWCGTLEFIKNNFSDYEVATERANIAELSGLPVAEWNEEKRVFVIKEETENV